MHTALQKISIFYARMWFGQMMVQMQTEKGDGAGLATWPQQQINIGTKPNTNNTIIITGLSLSFETPIALMFTPDTYFLLCEPIVPARGKFSHNTEVPSRILSRNRCYWAMAPNYGPVIMMVT